MSSESLLPDWLTQRATGAPDQLALVGSGGRLTWGALDAAARDMATRFHALGIGAGDRVAVLLGNGVQFVVVVHALIKLRALLVPLNTRLTAAELGWQLRDVRARLLLTDARNATRAVEASAALPDLLRWAVEAVPGWRVLDEIAPAAVSYEDRLDLGATHCIMYTSGTTGTPKGVLLLYGNHWWSAIGSALNLGTHTDDCWLAVLPLFHIGGLAIIMRSVIYGVPLIVHERFDPVAVNAAISMERVTLISVVANMLERMLDAQAEQPYPPTLRAVLLGGGPAPRPLLERCARLGVPVVQTYGMTETASQAVTLAPVDALRKLGSAGRPLVPVELRIVQNDVAVPAGAIGEIVVRGPNVTAGYADRADATARALRGGWLHTGDVGYLDADGFLYVVDRRDDLIISGGENVYPAEVEAVLRSHPAVADAGVVGLPDAQWGQTVAAAIVLAAEHSATGPELIEFCTQRLARYKIPRQIVFLPFLPRNAGGKLLRRSLRDSWA